MLLELDPLDLKPEFQSGSRQTKGLDQGINIRDVTFDKLTEQAQTAVRIIGRAVFYAFDRRSSTTIYPPVADQDHSRVPPDPQTEFMMGL